MQPPFEPQPISDVPLDSPPIGHMSPSKQHAALLNELDNADVVLGSHDRFIVGWLANLDWSTVATIASLIRRAGNSRH
ncbi:hypothetical protein [Streptomyces hokutonensis]|uniref:hypothetical protein n=1 Tax=Streptomyces hokutonensis TaxID=1306990 RepID=UPI00368F8996